MNAHFHNFRAKAMFQFYTTKYLNQKEQNNLIIIWSVYFESEICQMNFIQILTIDPLLKIVTYSAFVRNGLFVVLYWDILINFSLSSNEICRLLQNKKKLISLNNSNKNSNASVMKQEFF